MNAGPQKLPMDKTVGNYRKTLFVGKY